MSTNARRHRAIRNHKSPVYNWWDHCKVDMAPTIIKGVLYINLMPQNVTVGFKVSYNKHSVTFKLDSIIHCDRIRLRTELLAEQVLLPMVSLARIDPDNVIVEYRSAGDRHVRMIDSQWDKHWFIENKELSVFKSTTSFKNWSVTVSDASQWVLGGK